MDEVNIDEDRADYKTEVELAEAVSHGLNPMGFSADAFCLAMDRQHRTLQQNFMRVIVAGIKYNAKKRDVDFDLRNEDTVKACREIVKKMEGTNWDCMRFI